MKFKKFLGLALFVSLLATPALAQQGTVIGGTSNTYQGNLFPLAVTSVAVSAAGGAASHSYAPSDTVTLTGGTATTNAVLTVSTTQLSSVNSVTAGGTGCTNGSGKILTGTTGTGTKFQVSATASGNAIVSVESISVVGSYTVNPTSLTAEPVTGDSCTGTTLNINIGPLTASITTAGIYTVVPANPATQSASSGSGTGATWTLGFSPIGPTVPVVTEQKFTSGSGATYTTPAGVHQLRIRMVGGGGGGAGSGAGATSGSSGTDTIFNSYHAAAGGGGNPSSGAGGSGGTGGSNGTGATNVLRVPGQASNGSTLLVVATTGIPGGASLLGPGGAAGVGGSEAAPANSGGGGQGGTGSASVAGSPGGGSGEYVELIINNPSANYTYTIGGSGAAGTGGTHNGAAGGTGLLIVDESY